MALMIKSDIYAAINLHLIRKTFGTYFCKYSVIHKLIYFCNFKVLNCWTKVKRVLIMSIHGDIKICFKALMLSLQNCYFAIANGPDGIMFPKIFKRLRKLISCLCYFH